MGTILTNTAILNAFTTIRDILLTNSTLAKKFKKADFYEFEPSLDSISFDMLPYIVINIPQNSPELLVINHSTNLEELEIPITLVMGWEARSTLGQDGGNFRTFANAIIYQINASESTLDAIGYQNTKISLTDTSVDTIQGKKAVVGIFTLNCKGYIGR